MTCRDGLLPRDLLPRLCEDHLRLAAVRLLPCGLLPQLFRRTACCRFGGPPVTCRSGLLLRDVPSLLFCDATCSAYCQRTTRDVPLRASPPYGFYLVDWWVTQPAILPEAAPCSAPRSSAVECAPIGGTSSPPIRAPGCWDTPASDDATLALKGEEWP